MRVRALGLFVFVGLFCLAIPESGRADYGKFEELWTSLHPLPNQYSDIQDINEFLLTADSFKNVIDSIIEIIGPSNDLQKLRDDIATFMKNIENILKKTSLLKSPLCLGCMQMLKLDI